MRLMIQYGIGLRILVFDFNIIGSVLIKNSVFLIHLQMSYIVIAQLSMGYLGTTYTEYLF